MSEFVEKDFPRGKLEYEKSNKVKKSKKRKQKEENLFRVSKKDDGQQLKKKKLRLKKKNLEETEDEEKVVIERLKLESLPIDMNVIGCVMKVLEYEIHFVIPGGIECTVSINNVSSPYSKAIIDFTNDCKINLPPTKLQALFTIGQFFPLHILDKKSHSFINEGKMYQKILINASLKPEDIYQDLSINVLKKCDKTKFNLTAAVKTIEDHGYIMDIGKISGFLSFEDCKEYCEEEKIKGFFSIGQLIWCQIKSMDEHVLQLMVQPKKNKDKLLITVKDDEDLIFPESLFYPGLTFTATVMDIQSEGLEVMVLNLFKGFVHKDYLQTVWKKLDSYKIAQTINLSVLYMNPWSKTISLTCRSFDDELIKNIIKNFCVGEIIENAKVVDIQENGIMIFKVKKEFKAVAKIGDVSDERFTIFDLPVIQSQFPIGSEHSCRVKGFSLVDGYIKISLKTSLIQREEVKPEELEIGKYVNGKVKRISNDGVVIKLGYNLDAYITNLHLFINHDDHLNERKEKFYPIGKTIRARVHRIYNLNDTKANLTKNPILFDQNCKLIKSFDVDPGTEGDGIVVLKSDKGMLVEFFNFVSGYVNKNDFGSYSYDDYKVGSNVHCYVIKSNPKTKKMVLSLVPLNDSNEMN